MLNFKFIENSQLMKETLNELLTISGSIEINLFQSGYFFDLKKENINDLDRLFHVAAFTSVFYFSYKDKKYYEDFFDSYNEKYDDICFNKTVQMVISSGFLNKHIYHECKSEHMIGYIKTKLINCIDQDDDEYHDLIIDSNLDELLDIFMSSARFFLLEKELINDEIFISALFVFIYDRKIEPNITMAKYISYLGFSDVSSITNITGVSRSTLNDWFRNKRNLFNTVVLGCLFRQYKSVFADIKNIEPIFNYDN